MDPHPLYSRLGVLLGFVLAVWAMSSAVLTACGGKPMHECSCIEAASSHARLYGAPPFQQIYDACVREVDAGRTVRSSSLDNCIVPGKKVVP